MNIVIAQIARSVHDDARLRIYSARMWYDNMCHFRIETAQAITTRSCLPGKNGTVAGGQHVNPQTLKLGKLPRTRENDAWTWLLPSSLLNAPSHSAAPKVGNSGSLGDDLALLSQKVVELWLTGAV